MLGRIVFLLLSSMLLQACSGEKGLDDLRAFTAEAKAQQNPKVEPLPTIQPTEAFEYAAQDAGDPFSEANVLPEQQASLEVDPVLPDQDRIRQPLEYFPLDALKMVGTLNQGGAMYAVVYAPDDTVHRVTKGNYAGNQLGEILEVNEGEIVIEETFKARNGRWEKRQVSIALTE